MQGLCHWQNGGQRGDAVMQLHTGMDPVVRDALEEAVQLYGMRPIIYHDAISKECFGRGFCSATSGMEEWSSHLTNGAHANDPVALLFVQRVVSDFKRASDAVRKPLNYKDALYKHQIVGLQFQGHFPSHMSRI